MDDRMAYCKQWDNSNVTKDLFGIVFDMLFSKLYKIMVNGVTFVGFRRSIAPIAPLEPPAIAQALVIFAEAQKLWQ